MIQQFTTYGKKFPYGSTIIKWLCALYADAGVVAIEQPIQVVPYTPNPIKRKTRKIIMTFCLTYLVQLFSAKLKLKHNKKS